MNKETIIICGIVAIMEAFGGVFSLMLLIGRNIYNTDPAIIISAISLLSGIIWCYLLLSEAEKRR
ncbi:MAG: hypothetical protein K6A69_04305 [Lachnospiraceae bacterium]|nr:hypothetical protein [Lachnospiraceae bacterium]